eukprot:CAMPEP_0197526326 /NCGR_PEP_ID=MMETSP1318-20131121/17325_1 /TAXON_ID=552666 /ORGANISM="Partenskyella glossopodia, Strain RCC365" /LENGTH=334 /DNA_ID=CAMNT_0043080437 /DNA_START=174 /DNA_END=1175 /DNA_ORIENTATION=+
METRNNHDEIPSNEPLLHVTAPSSANAAASSSRPSSSMSVSGLRSRSRGDSSGEFAPPNAPLYDLAAGNDVINALPLPEIDGILAGSSGLLIRERFYWSQVLCAACERKTQYKIAQWDPMLPARLTDRDFKEQPLMLEIFEESDCCCRYCLLSARELDLGVFHPQHYNNMAFESNGYPAGQNPMLHFHRPFRCAIPCCCCMPFPNEMEIHDGPTGTSRGKIMQDWKWWNCCWCCNTYVNALDTNDNIVFTVNSPWACGNGCLNCCAPTCFNPVYTAFVTRPGRREGEYDSKIEVHWPGWNARGLCMANSAAENWILQFPEGSSPDEKVLLLGAW